MKLYVAKRQSGKTSKLIEESAKNKAIIVAPNEHMVNYIIKFAETINVDIPKPISVHTYLEYLASGGIFEEQKFLIDELQFVLNQMNVVSATFDESYVDKIDPLETNYSETCKVSL